MCGRLHEGACKGIIYAVPLKLSHLYINNDNVQLGERERRRDGERRGETERDGERRRERERERERERSTFCYCIIA